MGYVQKILILKKQHITLLLFKGQDRMSSHRRTQRGNGVARACRAGEAAEQTRRRAGELQGTVGRESGFEGQLMFLTAYFFICFIQLLQRVQEFLWGENVRGSWEGREDSEPTHLLQPGDFFPRFSIPQPSSGSSGSREGVGWNPWALSEKT